MAGAYIDALTVIARHRVLCEYRAERRRGLVPGEAALYLRNLYANTCAYELGHWGPDVAEHARILWTEADRLHHQVGLRALAMPYWELGRFVAMPQSLAGGPDGGH